MPAPYSSLQRAHLLPFGRQGARWGAKRDKAPVRPQGAQRLERKGDPPGPLFICGGVRATLASFLPRLSPLACGSHAPWSCARGSCAVRLAPPLLPDPSTWQDPGDCPRPSPSLFPLCPPPQPCCPLYFQNTSGSPAISLLCCFHGSQTPASARLHGGLPVAPTGNSTVSL